MAGEESFWPLFGLVIRTPRLIGLDGCLDMFVGTGVDGN